MIAISDVPRRNFFVANFLHNGQETDFSEPAGRDNNMEKVKQKTTDKIK